MLHADRQIGYMRIHLWVKTAAIIITLVTLLRAAKDDDDDDADDDDDDDQNYSMLLWASGPHNDDADDDDNDADDDDVFISVHFHFMQGEHASSGCWRGEGQFAGWGERGPANCKDSEEALGQCACGCTWKVGVPQMCAISNGLLSMSQATWSQGPDRWLVELVKGSYWVREYCPSIGKNRYPSVTPKRIVTISLEPNFVSAIFVDITKHEDYGRPHSSSRWC